MFAAKAGAKHVYGVDMATIVEQAQKIVALNGFADKVCFVVAWVSTLDHLSGPPDYSSSWQNGRCEFTCGESRYYYQ